MSVQTGALPPSGPASTRLVDRARYGVARLESEPNPLWIRELKQSVRLGRTPIVLMVIAILMTLLMASIGGALASQYAPADIGIALFHTFFSLAFVVVTWMGPAVAANSISSEREGRTWEAVLLTGLRPQTIARGKFLAAYSAVGMYIVMLAPVGAMSFLFGGVTATEVITAFAFLFLIAALSVAFGLAISSKMASMRSAVVVTLLLSVPLSLTVYLALGVGLSFGAHELWPGVPAGPPVWLPSAYDRAPFGIEYVIYLIVVPMVSIALPAWFLYEVTVANLATASDDRSTGLKKWFLVSTPVITLTASLPALVVPSDPDAAAIAGLTGLLAHLMFCAFVFQGEPVGPSRRVQLRWDRAKATRFRRALGPGIIQTSVMQLLVGAVAFSLVMGMGALAVSLLGAVDEYEQQTRIIVYGGYALGFYVFTLGFAAWNRARTTSPSSARVLLVVVLSAISVLPWVAAAVVGAMDHYSDDDLLVASPSPFYAVRMLVAVGNVGQSSVLIAGAACTVMWAVIGVGLLGLARTKARTVIADYDQKWAEADRRFDEEDEAQLQAAMAPAETETETEAETETESETETETETESETEAETESETEAESETNTEEAAPVTHRSGDEGS